jgi:kinesin family protein 6/9
MTGNNLEYEDRGIIPRTVNYIYERIAEDKDKDYSISVSYMEIYNNQGYDLLYDTLDHEPRCLETLPKV